MATYIRLDSLSQEHTMGWPEFRLTPYLCLHSLSPGVEQWVFRLDHGGFSVVPQEVNPLERMLE